jgi:N-acetylglucosaminyldiphosphoundecaprenol N-acetyl-beta-D-mannosaminyltransferase
MKAIHAPTIDERDSELPEPVWLWGVPVHPWTMQQTLEEIVRRMKSGRFTQHGVVNTAKIVNQRNDPELRQALLSCDIINADGMGVVLASRLLGTPMPQRVTGIDLFLHLLDRAVKQGEPVFLLGAEPEIVEKAAAELRVRYPGLKLAGWHHGYFWDDEAAVVRKIRESGARLLFVGITSPKKERFIHRWREELGVRFAMGVGGAFDVLAGKTRRSPLWMQRVGLEWLFRLLLEPGRLGKRYLVTNAVFLVLLISEWIKRR